MPQQITILDIIQNRQNSVGGGDFKASDEFNSVIHMMISSLWKICLELGKNLSEARAKRVMFRNLNAIS